MWPIPPLSHELVSISFSTDSIACSWIQKAARQTAPLVLLGYKRYELTNLELVNLVPFNPTIIRHIIRSFLNQYSIAESCIIFSFDDQSITEKFVAMPTSTPHRSDFGMGNSSNTLWQYRYVYQNDHGQYIFYVYRIARSSLLQYQLLAIAEQWNLITITTTTAALLEGYKSIFGKAFRKSQLAVDMARHDNNVEKLISIDALRRMITSPSEINIEQEHVHIAIACGLFYGEKEQ